MRNIVEKSMLSRAWVIKTNNIDMSGNDSGDALIEKIMNARGIIGDDAIAKFINPTLKEYMPDPDVLMDMTLAVKIIADHIMANKKIAVYGDYDVDGITASAIVVKYLREINADVIWHLPTREGEGYGLNCGAINKIADEGASLIITVDCGISAVHEIECAKKRGVCVVITDHHSPDSVLPRADAIINPKRADDTSGLSYLAGVGVAFLMLVALNRELKSRGGDISIMADKINLLNYLDLVALGTICDTMPLIELNRAFVATGLRVLGLQKNLGLRILMEVAGIKKPSVYAAGFAIGPRINAAGRLDSAAPALELMLTDNILIAYDLANVLHKMNEQRIEIQNNIMLAAISMADKLSQDKKCSLFVCGDNWHGGVMGIIAGRLKDKYNRPVCVATKSNGIINGSGRSIPSVDLGKIIHNALAHGIISEGGGHAAAAGFTMPADNLDAFCEFMETAAMAQLNGEIPISVAVVDAELDAGGADMKLIARLSDLEPFGQANPEPLLVLYGGTLKMATTMGNGNHLRGTIGTSRGTNLAFVGFNLVGTAVGDFMTDDANINTKITMLGKLKENEYNGRVSAQFILEDIYV